jgi:uncharacterized membrane protein YcaP (DUF421 family)
MEAMKWLLDLNEKEAYFIPILLKTTIIYISSLVMIRVGKKRFFGKTTAFDVILGIILGSVLSRAVNGTAPLFPTIASGFLLIFLHWALASWTFKSKKIGTLVKGRPIEVVKNGEPLHANMKKSDITLDDILEEVRINGNTDKLENVKTAHLERSGTISIVKESKEPKVLEIKVEEGIQTIRIKIES